MTALIDLAGQRFGRLEVLALDGRSKTGTAAWRCRCDCGTEVRVPGERLRSGNKRSCGCLARELTIERSRKRIVHGHARRSGNSPEFSSWSSIISRCRDPKNPGYRNYGGRGIRVCERWQGKHGFENFLADVGTRIPGTTLDRFPNNKGNYEPGNVRWATSVEQGNNKRTCIQITARGETRTASEWGRIVGLSAATIRNRIHAGWPADRAVFDPPMDFVEAGRHAGAVWAKRCRGEQVEATWPTRVRAKGGT